MVLGWLWLGCADDPAATVTTSDTGGPPPVGTLVDADRDGYGATVDCDDDDPAIHPAAAEILEDGIDQDCDGVDAIGDGSDDEDHDGATTATDCDDLDPTVHPGAPELAGDGIDQDCDGVDTATLASLAPGDLVLSEVMNDPLAAADEWAEWIELHNATATPVDLAGLEVTAEVAALGFTIDRSVQVAAGGYVVLVRDADPVVNGGVVGAFDYRSDLSLDNDRETLTLAVGEVVLDAVAFDDQQWFPDADGAAMALDPGHLDGGADGQWWCLAVAPYGAGDAGTPGAANDPCPDLGDADADGWVAAHDCDDTDADVHPTASDAGFDGVDADCDGADTDVADLGPGDLVVTEIMSNPTAVSDADGEWFEVYNATDTSIDLQGLVVDDGAVDTFTVDAVLVVEPGGYLVFAADADAIDNGGVTTVAYDYPSSAFELDNSVDTVVLRNGAVIDRVAFDGGVAFPDPSGATLSLDAGRETATANDQGANWCAATQRITQGDPLSDFGTPGAPNGSCP